jgi:hypothetical protein
MIIGSTIRPELLVNDYSGFANAAAIEGESKAQLGETIRSNIEKIVGMVAGVPMGGGGSGGGSSAGAGAKGASGGPGLVGSVMNAYQGIKQMNGQTDAFGKSMDAMSKAFPDQKGMFEEAKMQVMDPNASLIDRVARMNEFQNTLKMVQQQQMQNAQIQNYNARTAAAGGAAAGSGTPKTDYTSLTQ